MHKEYNVDLNLVETNNDQEYSFQYYQSLSKNLKKLEKLEKTRRNLRIFKEIQTNSKKLDEI